MAIDNAERERRRTLLNDHLAAENDHDVERIMKTFSADTEMIYNGRYFSDHESIRWAHGYFGWSSAQGAFSNLRVVVEREHFTEDEIVTEQRLFGKHVGEFLGFPATGRNFELRAVGFYHFDKDGKLKSERVVMNLGPLAGEQEGPPPG
jgi:steroid delta-isomerase-like uncharacterized protein